MSVAAHARRRTRLLSGHLSQAGHCRDGLRIRQAGPCKGMPQIHARVGSSMRPKHEAKARHRLPLRRVVVATSDAMGAICQAKGRPVPIECGFGLIALLRTRSRHVSMMEVSKGGLGRPLESKLTPTYPPTLLKLLGGAGPKAHQPNPVEPKQLFEVLAQPQQHLRSSRRKNKQGSVCFRFPVCLE